MVCRPTAFRPERWNADAADPVSEQAWFPFGGGQRTCIGTRFAQVATALILATRARGGAWARAESASHGAHGRESAANLARATRKRHACVDLSCAGSSHVEARTPPKAPGRGGDKRRASGVPRPAESLACPDCAPHTSVTCR
ncbi:cytochrome P450 [Streptomyces mirabilis]|uniref:cytochrome P450 n=1 Tax=Streptomyces mirabilis TaxID=68239 RepID=UPI003D9E835F